MPADLYIAEDQNTHTTEVDISALFSPNINAVGRHVYLTIERNDGLIVDETDFASGSTKVDKVLPVTDTAHDFTITAWLDDNRDGILDGGAEETYPVEDYLEVDVDVVPPWTAQGNWTAGQAAMIQANVDGASLQQLAQDITGNAADASLLNNVGTITRGELIDVTPLLTKLDSQIRANTAAAADVSSKAATFGSLIAYKTMNETAINQVFTGVSSGTLPVCDCWGMASLEMAEGVISVLKPGEFDELGLNPGSFDMLTPGPYYDSSNGQLANNLRSRRVRLFPELLLIWEAAVGRPSGQGVARGSGYLGRPAWW